MIQQYSRIVYTEELRQMHPLRFLRPEAVCNSA